MAGGTGGHVFPALAVAEQLRAQGIRVSWLGTRTGLEATLIPQSGCPIDFLSIRGLRGKGLLGWFRAPLRLIHAVYQAMIVCIRLRPNVVLGMGGFVTGPGGIACRILCRPLVVHEQNAIPGMTNRWLAKVASRVLEAFPGSFPASGKLYCTGNPVRTSILQLERPAQRYARREGAIRVLVIGGSLGAQSLNENVPLARAQLDAGVRPQVWHQTGRNKLDATVACYAQAGVEARVMEFVADMEAAYAWADLLICRAGAMTISEISNAGVAAILVPYPYAVDDHQTANARYLSAAGAAILIQQVDITPQRLAAELRALITAGRARLLDMAEQALGLAKPNATQDVVQHCLAVAR